MHASHIIMVSECNVVTGHARVPEGLKMIKDQGVFNGIMVSHYPLLYNYMYSCSSWPQLQARSRCTYNVMKRNNIE